MSEPKGSGKALRDRSTLGSAGEMMSIYRKLRNYNTDFTFNPSSKKPKKEKPNED